MFFMSFCLKEILCYSVWELCSSVTLSKNYVSLLLCLKKYVLYVTLSIIKHVFYVFLS